MFNNFTNKLKYFHTLIEGYEHIFKITVSDDKDTVFIRFINDDYVNTNLQKYVHMNCNMHFAICCSVDSNICTCYKFTFTFSDTHLDLTFKNYNLKNKLILKGYIDSAAKTYIKAIDLIHSKNKQNLLGQLENI